MKLDLDLSNRAMYALTSSTKSLTSGSLSKILSPNGVLARCPGFAAVFSTALCSAPVRTSLRGVPRFGVPASLVPASERSFNVCSRRILFAFEVLRFFTPGVGEKKWEVC